MTKEKGTYDLSLFDVRESCNDLADCVDRIRRAQDDAERTSACLVALDALGVAFYAASASIGVHPVIEFTGLLRIYTAQIKAAVKSGVPLHEISGVHGDRALLFSAGQAAYVAEKLDCIWGESFRQDEQAARSVFDQLLGEKVAESLALECLSTQAYAEHLSSRDKLQRELIRRGLAHLAGDEK